MCVRGSMRTGMVPCRPIATQVGVNYKMMQQTSKQGRVTRESTLNRGAPAVVGSVDGARDLGG